MVQCSIDFQQWTKSRRYGLYSIYTYHTQALKGGMGVSREEDNALQKIIRIIIRIIIITTENY